MFLNYKNVSPYAEIILFSDKSNYFKLLNKQTPSLIELKILFSLYKNSLIFT